jgi:hypothetical protein
MDCTHQWDTAQTVSWNAYKAGEPKFRSGFERMEAAGIKVIAARRKVCRLCGEAKSTVELNWPDVKAILPDDGRTLLADVLSRTSRGEFSTTHEKCLTYKEAWESVCPHEPWTPENFRKCTRQVVNWIVEISNEDIEAGRPPRNALVVRADTGMPGKDWQSWARASGVTKTYPNAKAAQAACWAYWG